MPWFINKKSHVKKVMSNTVFYADQFGDPPRSLKQRLGIVPGKDSPPTDNRQASANEK